MHTVAKINRSDSTLSDMINRRELNNDSDGEAAVRDGQETIEALVLVKTSDTEYSLFSRDAVFDITSVPDNVQAKLIAKQRLRLPAFSVSLIILVKRLRYWQTQCLRHGEMQSGSKVRYCFCLTEITR